MTHLLETKHNGYGFTLHKVEEIGMPKSAYKEHSKVVIPDKSNKYQSKAIMDISLDSKFKKALHFVDSEAVAFLNSIVEDADKKSNRAVYVDSITAKRGIDYTDTLFKLLVGVCNDLTIKGYDVLYLVEGPELMEYLDNSNLLYAVSGVVGEDDLKLYVIRLNSISISANGDSTVRPLETDYKYSTKKEREAQKALSAELKDQGFDSAKLGIAKPEMT